jgi:hypothetical protein
MTASTKTAMRWNRSIWFWRQPSIRVSWASFDRGVKRARFAVLREATVPSVLIEGGFLTEPTEAAQIASANWRQQYANAIAVTSGTFLYVRRADACRLPSGEIGARQLVMQRVSGLIYRVGGSSGHTAPRLMGLTA